MQVSFVATSGPPKTCSALMNPEKSPFPVALCGPFSWKPPGIEKMFNSRSPAVPESLRVWASWLSCMRFRIKGLESRIRCLGLWGFEVLEFVRIVTHKN